MIFFDSNTNADIWGVAVTSAAYLINQAPSSMLNFQTPLQTLADAVIAPNASNLPPHIFGCVAFMHLHKHKHNKLTSQELRCVFVGYALHHKGYRCYCRVSRVNDHTCMEENKKISPLYLTRDLCDMIRWLKDGRIPYFESKRSFICSLVCAWSLPCRTKRCSRSSHILYNYPHE